MADVELPQLLDKVDLRMVAALTLDDGECLTADLLRLNDERDELIVDVVSTNRSYPNSGQRDRAIPIRRIISCERRPRAEQPWPYSDPCKGASFSFARFVLMATLLLCLTIGSLPLFFLLMKRPYGFQAASAIVYTILAVFFTFARTGTRTGKDRPPYMFTCPAVQTHMLRCSPTGVFSTARTGSSLRNLVHATFSPVTPIRRRTASTPDLAYQKLTYTSMPHD
jgi:hypothetical protein